MNGSFRHAKVAILRLQSATDALLDQRIDQTQFRRIARAIWREADRHGVSAIVRAHFADLATMPGPGEVDHAA